MSLVSGQSSSVVMSDCAAVVPFVLAIAMLPASGAPDVVGSKRMAVAAGKCRDWRPAIALTPDCRLRPVRARPAAADSELITASSISRSACVLALKDC